MAMRQGGRESGREPRLRPGLFLLGRRLACRRTTWSGATPAPTPTRSGCWPTAPAEDVSAVLAAWTQPRWPTAWLGQGCHCRHSSIIASSFNEELSCDMFFPPIARQIFPTRHMGKGRLSWPMSSAQDASERGIYPRRCAATNAGTRRTRRAAAGKSGPAV